MNLVVPNQGERLMLEAAVGKTPATAWTLRLFVNDHTPASDDTEANYTEAAGAGYAGIALVAGNWSTVEGAPTIATQPTQTFTFSGALTGDATIYGYYVTDADGRLVYAQRLDTTFKPANTGDFIRVTPRLTLASITGD